MGGQLTAQEKQSIDFRDHVVLVTGASSGIGRSLAKAFAGAGARLVLADVDREGLQAAMSELEGPGSDHLAVEVDVSSRREMEEMARDVLGETGRVDILVNNAGVGVGGELKDIPTDSLEWITGVNLMGVIYGTRLFLPGMVERGGGHIVNVASLSGLMVLPLHIAYTTTKYGVRGFSEALWVEARNHGVGVTLVCPYATRTNIMAGTRVYPEESGERDGNELWASLLKKRGMDPDDVAWRILKAVKENRFLLLMGFQSHLIYNLTRFFPDASRRLVSALTRKISGP